jgi:hypothetical protein
MRPVSERGSSIRSIEPKFGQTQQPIFAGLKEAMAKAPLLNFNPPVSWHLLPVTLEGFFDLRQKVWDLGMELEVSASEGKGYTERVLRWEKIGPGESWEHWEQVIAEVKGTVPPGHTHVLLKRPFRRGEHDYEVDKKPVLQLFEEIQSQFVKTQE